MSYPEKIIRGVSNKDFIDAEGRALASMFQFEDAEREDELQEASINWYDDNGALSLLMVQKKKDKDEYQFKVGAAIMMRCWLDNDISRPNVAGALTYERNPIEGESPNPYHGNLLRKSGLSNQIKNMLAACLASCVDHIEYR